MRNWPQEIGKTISDTYRITVQQWRELFWAWWNTCVPELKTFLRYRPFSVETKLEYCPFSLGVANAGHSGIQVGQSHQNNENSEKSKDEREINKMTKIGESPASNQEQHNDAEGKCMPMKLNAGNA